MDRQSEQVKESRGDVDQLRGSRISERLKTRGAEHQRDPHLLLVDAVGVGGRAVLIEGLAVIAGHHHDRPVPRAPLLQPVEEPGQLDVDVGQAVGVDLLHDVDLLARKHSRGDGERNLRRSEPAREIGRDPERQMAVLQIEVEEERRRGNGLGPLHGLGDRRGVVERSRVRFAQLEQRLRKPGHFGMEDRLEPSGLVVVQHPAPILVLGGKEGRPPAERLEDVVDHHPRIPRRGGIPVNEPRPQRVVRREDARRGIVGVRRHGVAVGIRAAFAGQRLQSRHDLSGAAGRAQLIGAERVEQDHDHVPPPQRGAVDRGKILLHRDERPALEDRPRVRRPFVEPVLARFPDEASGLIHVDPPELRGRRRVEQVSAHVARRPRDQMGQRPGVRLTMGRGSEAAHGEPEGEPEQSERAVLDEPRNPLGKLRRPGRDRFAHEDRRDHQAERRSEREGRRGSQDDSVQVGEIPEDETDAFGVEKPAAQPEHAPAGPEGQEEKGDQDNAQDSPDRRPPFEAGCQEQERHRDGRDHDRQRDELQTQHEEPRPDRLGFARREELENRVKARGGEPSCSRHRERPADLQSHNYLYRRLRFFAIWPASAGRCTSWRPPSGPTRPCSCPPRASTCSDRARSR